MGLSDERKHCDHQNSNTFPMYYITSYWDPLLTFWLNPGTSQETATKRTKPQATATNQEEKHHCEYN